MTPRNAYLKAKKAKERIPTLEPVIASDAEAAYLYSRDVIKGRWREAEPLICGDHSTAIDYASDVIGGRWKALEAVLNDPWDCFLYAAIVIRGRWKKAESIIRTDPGAATRYAEEILKRRWRAAEPTIAGHASWAASYAVNVICGRWPRVEAAIAKDGQAATDYLAVLAQKWNPRVVVLCSLWMYEYARVRIQGKLPDAMHNRMLMQAMADPQDTWAKKYFSTPKLQRPKPQKRRARSRPKTSCRTKGKK